MQLISLVSCLTSKAAATRQRAARQRLATDKLMRHTIYCDTAHADCLIAYQITIPAKEILIVDVQEARIMPGGLCVSVTRRIGRVKRI